ncbi:hypothetical protein EWM64_g6547 [Hericium alpestre]|uniref:Transcription factor domain-containing protein n=1 Tax=Hericium alpestre TaxID=135208 RepID=A0A4Y9ZTX1_9AGAM|nr:hypothetical protein EWM64_g6547 [Hericium alpestre]
MAARIETLEAAVQSLLAAQGYESLDAYRLNFEELAASSPTSSQPAAQSPDSVPMKSSSDSDILSIPIHRWSVPSLAVRDFILNQRGPQSRSTSGVNLTLSGLITPKLSEDLLRMFGQLYQPWLPYTVPLPPSSILLLLTVYVLAFRHLPVSARRASLYQAVLQRFYNCLMASLMSFCTEVETVFALSIIYKWAPPAPPGTDISYCQPAFLLGVASRFMTSLEVDHAPAIVLQTKRNPTAFGNLSAEQLNAVLEKARLQYTISLDRNAAILGSSLPPTPFSDPQPALVLGPPDVSNPENCRDARMIYYFALLQIATEGMEIPGPGASAVGPGPGWLNALVQHGDAVLHKLDEWDADFTRMLANVPDSQAFYFRVLHWEYWGYRLMILTRLIVACRHGDSSDLPLNAIGYLHETRLAHLSQWSSLSGPVAETIVRDAVVGDDLLDILAVVPDHVFNTVMFATAYIIKGQTWSLDYTVGEVKYEETDAIVNRLVEMLDKISLRNDHLPKKFVALIHALMRSWKEKRRRLRRAAERWVSTRPGKSSDSLSTSSTAGPVSPLNGVAGDVFNLPSFDVMAFDGDPVMQYAGAPDVSLDQLVDMFGYNFSQPSLPSQPQPQYAQSSPQAQHSFWPPA